MKLTRELSTQDGHVGFILHESLIQIIVWVNQESSYDKWMGPIVVPFLIVATLIFSTITSADECFDWFADANLKKGTAECPLACKVLKVDMSTFSCHERCDDLCNVSHCEHSKYWQPKVKSGRPDMWGLKSEVSTEWTKSEKEVISSLLDRLPDGMRAFNVGGIYRMKKSVAIINPGTTQGNTVVIYDRAFENPFWKPEEVLLHELGHVVYSDFREKDRMDYTIKMGWKTVVRDEFYRKGEFLSSRAKDSPTEDFAENFSAFLLNPAVLKQKVPAAEDWLVKNLEHDLF